MVGMMEWMCCLGVLAAIGIPLLYAIATLEGLQHKTVYPLLRFVKHNGPLRGDAGIVVMDTAETAYVSAATSTKEELWSQPCH